MATIQHIEITSLPDYLDIILGTTEVPDALWFRGEPRDYKSSILTPSVFRENGFYEKNMFFEFYQRHYPNYRHFNNFQWLCLMQHYNLPTRLLDWTTNPLIALYFAATNIKEDGFVYEISPGILNNKTGSPEICTGDNLFVRARAEMVFWSTPSEVIHSDKFNTLSEEEKNILNTHLHDFDCYPLAVIPEITNERMLVQSCRFTIHGGNMAYAHTPKLISECADIMIYRIKKNYKEKILKNLDYISINAGTLFPEIEHTANYLRMKYKS